MTNVSTTGKTEANTMPSGFGYRCSNGHTHKTCSAFIHCQQKKHQEGIAIEYDPWAAVMAALLFV